MLLDEETKKQIKTIRALCDVAESNFPGATDIQLVVRGEKNSGTVTVPWYIMGKLLDAALEAK